MEDFLAYYMGFSSASWEFQTNFGGRIVPTRAVGAQALGQEWANAEEVENLPRKEKAMRELQDRRIQR